MTTNKRGQRDEVVDKRLKKKIKLSYRSPITTLLTSLGMHSDVVKELETAGFFSVRIFMKLLNEAVTAMTRLSDDVISKIKQAANKLLGLQKLFDACGTIQHVFIPFRSRYGITGDLLERES